MKMRRQSASLDDLSVKEIMDRWPETASAFIARRMHCVGCPIGPFHMLTDAAGEHRLDAVALAVDVETGIKASREPGRRR
jgi:hybrid cluster-associated redox disulfide protein